jgi:hypothetical protein
MNKIKRFFKKRKAEKEYNNYIYAHKNYIYKAFFEMVNCRDLEWIIQDPEILNKLWDRAIDHDESKFSKEEYDAYRKHFYGIDEEESSNEIEFKYAVDHHYAVNDHHWQHRVNWKDEDFDINTELACLENIMNWLAVGYRVGNRPYEYYEKYKDIITLPAKQKQFMEKCIYQGIDKEIIIRRQEQENEISE